MNPTDNPAVYKAVRAVGILKPEFGAVTANGHIFADKLNVRGTAFWLKEYNVLITCAHVIKDLIGPVPVQISGLLMVGNLGQYERATVSIIDFMHDLAVLHLTGKSTEEIHREAQDGLKLAKEYPAVSTKVSYAGFPLGDQLLSSDQAPTYAEGVIGATVRDRGHKKEIQISGPVIGGFSGSPIVVNDEVVGVVSNSPSKEAGSASIFMTISWEHIRSLAELASTKSMTTTSSDSVFIPSILEEQTSPEQLF